MELETLLTVPLGAKPGDRADEQENRTRSKVPSVYGEMSAACDVTRTGLRVANA
jgi:hypothetical protein